MTSPGPPAPSGLLDLLFDDAAGARCLVAPDGRVLRANAEWLRFVGPERHHARGADVVATFTDRRDVALAMYARARAGHRVEVPRHPRRIQGRATWWEARIEPVALEDGAGLLVTAREVSGEQDHAEVGPGGGRSASTAAEEALRESERRFRTLFTNMTEGFALGEAICDAAGVPRDFTFLEMNEAFEAQAGLAREAFRGRPTREVLPHLEQSWVDTYCGVALGAPACRFESYNADLGRHFSVYCFSPSPGRFAILFTDVTQRKQAEAELRAAFAAAEDERRRLAAVLDALPAGVAIADAQGKVLQFNEALERIWGGVPLPENAAEYAAWRGWWPETGEPLAATDWAMARTLATGEAVQGEVIEIERFGGSERLTIINAAAPIRNAEGQVIGGVVAEVDITAQKRAEAALRESEQRFRLLADAMPQLVWTAQPDGTVDYYNCRYVELAGIDRAPEGSWVWAPVVHPDDAAATVAAWQRSVATGEPYQIEHRVQLADGSFRWYLSRAVPARDARGRVVKWYGTATDIHDQKAAQDALREADRRKSEFLAVLSHELRNPLAPIRNGIYLLDRAAPGSEQASRAREIVRRQTEHLTRLIEDLLDMTRISRGKIELRRARVDLREIVSKTTDDLHTVFGQAGVELRVADLGDAPAWIDADATRLAQVIGNLLQNSVKFTPDGGSVTVTLSVNGDRAELCVRDTGFGMDPSTVDRMFEPFAQADQPLARTKGGLGLGLALVKNIVELHDGSVRARSEGMGRGAEFVVELPLAGGERVEAAREPAAQEGSAGKMVLVIEDNLDAGESLAELLELAGHRARVARDGRSGIALARELVPDVIVCDIGLPDLDGYAVVRALRGVDALRKTRLVALSGYAQPQDRARALAAGFDAHLAKPPDFDELMRVVAGGG